MADDDRKPPEKSDIIIPTDRGLKSFAEIIDDLTYSSYRANRFHHPEITIERWARIYPEAAALERRFQEELKQAKSA